MRWKYLIIIIFLIILGTLIYNGLYQGKIPSLTPEPVTDGNDMVMVDYPTKEAVVSSPLTVTGKARGSWYFEAVFPVVLVDWDGQIIAEAQARAKSNWMTPAYVPFEATLTFANPATAQDFTHRGILILRKDNPSGLPANDATLEIPVRFK